MSKKATGVIFIVLGAALIVSALLLLFYNRNDDARAGQEAETLLAGVEAVLESAPETPPPQEDAAAPELPVAEVNGYECAGIIELPTLEIKLPVLAEWDDSRLKTAPCRQFGAPETDDFVIAGHNYTNHFGKLSNLTAGDPVLFTEMDGTVNAYAVAEVRTLLPTEVEAVQNSGYDLVLYTCTLSGKERTAVFCNREK